MKRVFSRAVTAAHTGKPVAQFSEHRRYDEVDGQMIRMWIYRFDDSGWILRAVSSRGASAVWRERFATEELALLEYERTLKEHGGGVIVRAGELVKALDGFNPDLLQPQDERYRHPKTTETYTLRTFELLRKYSGLWPVQSMQGHLVTGYLYEGDAPAWPHAVHGIPGSPENIHTEFTLPARHIEGVVTTEMGLRKTVARGGTWWL